MADMIDVILARAMTPQGRLETYAQLSAQAIANANEAVATIEAAADNIDTVTQQTNENNEAAAAALEAAEAAANNYTTIINNINTEIDKLVLSLTQVNNNGVISTNLVTTYPDETTASLSNIVKLYTSIGSNADGAMTQKAISDALAQLSARIEAVAAIANSNTGGGNSGGGSTNLGSENAGSVVVVGPDGNIIASDATEQDIINLIIGTGSYTIKDVVGLQIDYTNSSIIRTSEAETIEAGIDFNKYAMFGGRKRCNVSDDGTITAFYGDSNYRDDGSNGQVMVYQPKFYYKREPITLDGINIRKEVLLISDEPKAMLKVHPLFINKDGEEIDYVLFSAYEGTAQDIETGEYFQNDESNIDTTNDKLASVAGAQPISGVNKTFTIANAEQMAQNRGTDWHIMNIMAQSALQMLMLVELGTMNAQEAIETGITNVNSAENKNCSSYTGSTAHLGNDTGYSTTGTLNKSTGMNVTYKVAGRRAISYRGMENPYGNIWNFLAGITIVGNGASRGGVPYICTDYNYNFSTINSSYKSIGFSIPGAHDWISAMGYNNPNYDWAYLPAEASGANSSLPVGDIMWGINNVKGYYETAVGGKWNNGDDNGIFCYAFDYEYDNSALSKSARLLLVPTKNTIHNNNVTLWQSKMGV